VEPTVASVELLAAWDLKSPIGIPQDASKVSRAPRLSKSQGQIDWNRSARQIDCHVRGMQPWPGAFTDVYVDEEKAPIRIAVKAVTVETRDGVDEVSPGTLIDDQCLRIATGPMIDQNNDVPAEYPGVIRIDRLQPAGRNEVSGAEFMRGYRLRAGIRLR
jgi:methionyl-tRNA formyltransferase